MTSGLPDSEFTSINNLLQIFDHTTNSYKYLFFLSLLEQIQAHVGEDAPRLQVRTLIEGALALAWYPHSYFKLSFGSQDQIGRILSTTSLPLDAGTAKLTPLDLDTVRAAIRQELSAAHYKRLARWVQFRLLTPWFQDELRGLNDTQKNQALARLSRSHFHANTPLYRLESDAGDEVQLHPDWVAYIRRNQVPLRDWTLWQFLHYMQARNPAVPNVAGKLRPPQERASLHRQRTYWTSVIDAGKVTCVFTGQPLTTLDALDHFLPWSFVLHDRLWNLVPITTAVNSAKRDRLPDRSFLPRLASVHADALTAAQGLMPSRAWQAIALEYVDDLRLPMDEVRGAVTEPQVLQKMMLSGYERVVDPLLQLADHQGFVAGWMP